MTSSEESLENVLEILELVVFALCPCSMVVLLLRPVLLDSHLVVSPAFLGIDEGAIGIAYFFEDVLAA